MIKNEQEIIETAKKAKKEKKIRKQIASRTKELLTYYSSADKDKIDAYRSLIEHLAFIDIMLVEFRENILTTGLYVEYQNGKNQSGIKKNDSVDLFKKWYSDRLTDSERVERLLGVEVESGSNELEEFLSRRKTR